MTAFEPRERVDRDVPEIVTESVEMVKKPSFPSGRRALDRWSRMT